MNIANRRLERKRNSSPHGFDTAPRNICARMMHNIAFAVSGGGMAGIAAHQSLVFGLELVH
ncbi:hypothetical protein FJV76_06180 [Mesorhizobium sp. WSM4303]|nr:hypothetical protein FJV77_20470 [Mesorhizobium sp. WSM4306]TRD07424.1 hypothetical protein FJV76_06180 [Mesorhizobium sp. WSM4303]